MPPQSAAFGVRGAKSGGFLGNQAYERRWTQCLEEFRLQASATGRDRRDDHVAGELAKADGVNQLPLRLRVQAADIENTDATPLGAQNQGKVV